MDDRAREIIIETMKKLEKSGRGAYEQFVPIEAESELVARSGGKVSRAQAHNRIKETIAEMVKGGQLHAPSTPYARWTLKE